MHGTHVLVLGDASCSLHTPSPSRWLAAFTALAAVIRWLAALVSLSSLRFKQNKSNTACFVTVHTSFTWGFLQGHNSCIVHRSLFRHMNASAYRNNVHIQLYIHILIYTYTASLSYMDNLIQNAWKKFGSYSPFSQQDVGLTKSCHLIVVVFSRIYILKND